MIKKVTAKQALGILFPHRHKCAAVSGYFMWAIIVALTICLLSCTDRSTRPTPIHNDTGGHEIVDTSKPTARQSSDTFQNSSTPLCPWRVDFDNKTKKRNPKFRNEDLNVDSLIKGLNELYPDIKLEKTKMASDTLHMKIKDSQYLTERMGTTGAASYLATTIINLTSVKSVKYVEINFAEGSHASPGIWSLKDFRDYKEVQ